MAVTSKTATPATVSVNEPFNWTIVVKNNGPGKAINATFKDTLPAGMVLTGAPTTPYAGATCSDETSTPIQCTLGDMPKSDTATITVPVKITSYNGATATNTAKVLTDSIDINSTNDTKSGDVAVVVSSIAGTVFHDSDNDGLPASETGINSVEVKLSGKDSWGKNVNLTQLTTGGGKYKFINLSPSNGDGYTVTETEPGTPYLDGKDSHAGAVVTGSAHATAATDAHAAIALAAATDLTQYDFGEVKRASIGGLVWHDKDNDGVLDASETDRIGSVRVDLTGTDDLGNVVLPGAVTTETSSSGTYSFTGLRPGTYKVTETEPGSPWLPGLAKACTIVGVNGGTPNNSPLTDPKFGSIIDAIGLSSGTSMTTCNFGELKPSSIAGTVYYDFDSSHTKTGKPIIGSVKVTLTGTDYRGNAVTPVDATSDTTTGAYSFTNLLPGTYALAETQPSPYFDGSVQLGTSSGTAHLLDANGVTAIALGSEVAATGYDFGELSSGISGYVFDDLDNDGIKDAGEAGIKDVDVALSGCESRTMKTLADGSYFFGVLPACPAGYTVTETQPTSYLDGKVHPGSPGGGIAGTNQIATIVLANSTYSSSNDFGEHLQSTPTDLVCSVVAPGNRSLREPFDLAYTVKNNGTGAAPVTTFKDTLPSGFEIASVSSSLAGACALTGTTGFDCALGYLLPSASVTVTASIKATVYPSGGSVDNTATAATAGHEATAGDNSCVTSLVIKKSTIAGWVYEDLNDSGVKDANETGIKDVEIKLSGVDAYDNTVDLTATTLADGSYKFDDLSPANAAGYKIKETQPAKYVDGKDKLGDQLGTLGNDEFTAIPLGSGVDGKSYDLGEHAVGLSGSVFNDLNDDGIRDAGELGIPGVLIKLSGCKAAEATTDSDGRYLIGDLPACAGYTLTETQPSGFSDGKVHHGTTGGDDTVANIISGINFAGNEHSSSNDFGEHGQVATNLACAVSDPGTRNLREPFDLIFTLTNSGPAAAPATTLKDTLPAGFELTAAPTTDKGACSLGTGSTSFACDIGFVLSPATIKVTANIKAIGNPAGGTASNTATAATEGNDSDATNDACQSILTIQKSSLAGIVFDDLNNNGTQDEGEPGIKDAEVKLAGTDAYLNPVALTTLTLADGSYKFDNLSPADATGYTVTETQPSSHGDGQDKLGSSGGTLANDSVSAIKLAGGVDATGYNFGEHEAGLSGHVFDDPNNDGIFDTGEQPIPDVAVTLTGCGENRTTKTLADGSYLFSKLPACSYTVTETQPSGFSDGKVHPGPAGGTAGVNTITGIVVGASDYALSNDFGELRQVDTNIACAVADPGTHTMFQPFNLQYTLTNAGPGSAPATKLRQTLPAGFEVAGALPASCTATGKTAFTCIPGYLLNGAEALVTVPVRAVAYPANGLAANSATVTTEGNDTDTANNTCTADLKVTQSTLAGKVFEDPDNNGLKDLPNNKPIENVTIKLTGKDTYGNDLALETKTLADGTYLFGGLAPSDATGYTVMEVQPAGVADGKDTQWQHPAARSPTTASAQSCCPPAPTPPATTSPKSARGSPARSMSTATTTASLRRRSKVSAASR